MFYSALFVTFCFVLFFFFYLFFLNVSVCCFFFFFSSRRRHTRCLSDWSSDVCSSDLKRLGLRGVDRDDAGVRMRASQHLADELARQIEVGAEARAPRDLVHTVRADRARADVALPVGPVRAVLGHDYPFLKVAAASCTALTILSYPVHRQRFPASQKRISCSVGFAERSSSALLATRKPGVQTPHWSAACSRNFCCSGWSFSPLARPSIVSMRRPPTSQPSTRQEQTRRPSSVTLQAPQSPEAQPSLLPVRFRVSRRTSRRVSSVSQRNSTASPFTVVSIWCLAISSSSLGPVRSGPLGASARRPRRCETRPFPACRRSGGTPPAPRLRAAAAPAHRGGCR